MSDLNHILRHIEEPNLVIVGQGYAGKGCGEGGRDPGEDEGALVVHGAGEVDPASQGPTL